MSMSKDVPFFTIDLDRPPSARWTEVVTHFKDALVSVMHIVDHIISQVSGGETVSGWIDALLASSFISQRVLFVKEIEAIAAQAELPLGKLIAMQLIYEACANCTSIVAPVSVKSAPEQTLYRHIRSMDWEMAFLKPLTLEASFVKGEKEVFRCTTWAGYTGVLTGMGKRDNSLSIAVNFRSIGSGSFLTNLKCALRDSWPIGFLVRTALTDATGYAEAVAWLRSSELIAPTYFTVCGSEVGQGCLITRDRDREDSFLGIGDAYGTEPWSDAVAKHAATRGILLHSSSNRPPTVKAFAQTNMDHTADSPDQSILWSLERRRLSMELIGAEKGDEIAVERLWRLMSQPPIRNDITVYASLMVPSAGTFVTRLPVERFGFQRPSGRPIAGRLIAETTCGVCHAQVVVDLNCPGRCRHTGTWHAQYGDCKWVKCARGLQVRDWGNAHWSCCYSVNPDPNEACAASGFHAVSE